MEKHGNQMLKNASYYNLKSVRKQFLRTLLTEELLPV